MLWRVIKFTNDGIVLKNETDTEIVWPNENWPDEWSIGDQLEIDISKPRKFSHENLADKKAIIRAIINLPHD
jgi:hypothetical protein